MQTDNIKIELLGGHQIAGKSDNPVQWRMSFRLRPPPDSDWCHAFESITQSEFAIEPDSENEWDSDDINSSRTDWRIHFDKDEQGTFHVDCDSDEIEILCDKLQKAVQRTNADCIKRGKRKEQEMSYVSSVQKRIEDLKSRFNSQ